MGKRIICAILLAIVVFCTVKTTVYAKEDSQMAESILSEFDFNEINDVMGDVLPAEKLSFQELVTGLVSGKLTFSAELIGRFIFDQVAYEFHYNKQSLIHILIISVIAAVFSNFSNAFQNRQISEISFYMLYLLLITLCLNSFRVAIGGISESLTQLTNFMKVLGPAYFLAVAIAAGSVTSIVFYNLVLLLIYLIELLILHFLLPLIHVYIMLKILNHLSMEDYLSKFAELVETVIVWTLKTLLACVIGMNVIQGLISPVIDSIKRSVITRGAEAIPGIGDALGGVTEVVLGTAVLVKNGIGMAGAIICISICAVPLIQMAVTVLMYKLVAALIQPVSDKRIVECISSIGDGCQLLLRVIFTVGVLFLLTIAVVAATTS